MSVDGILVRERGSRTGVIDEQHPHLFEDLSGRSDGAAARSDDWPHTTRLMPWLLAGFMATVFLIPIDGTELKVHLPVDSKPDRFLIMAMAGLLIIKALLPKKTGERRGRRRMTFAMAAVLDLRGSRSGQRAVERRHDL